jgi:hypothetical protein
MRETEEISLVREVPDIWIKLIIKHRIYTTAPCWFVHIPSPPPQFRSIAGSSETFIFLYVDWVCWRINVFDSVASYVLIKYTFIYTHADLQIQMSENFV